MDVDATGKENVCKLINLSGLSRFSIYRNGGTGRIPVFEFIKTQCNNLDAQKAFNSWADAIIAGGSTGVVYDILLFDKIQVDTDEDGTEEIQGRSKKSVGKIRYTFSLKSGHSLAGHERQPQEPQVNIQEIVSNAVKQALDARDKDDLRREVLSLKNEIKELREDQEEYDEPESNDSKILGLLSGIMNNNKQQPPALAGVEVIGAEEAKPKPWSKEEAEKIGNACQRIRKFDPDIANDLMLLANMAEKQTGQFNFLLGALRK